MTQVFDKEVTAHLPFLDAQENFAFTADALAGLIEKDGSALRALRQLILEGLESGDDGEADDQWLASLMEGVRQRAASGK